MKASTVSPWGVCGRRVKIDIEQQVKIADAYMYEAKQAHYQNRNYDRRKR